METNRIREIVEKYSGVAVGPETAERFGVYLQYLLEYNRNVNLTAITDPEEALVKHFADSLALLRYVEIPQGASLCDVGTGAGFPAAAILCARPDLKVTLVDSVGKKLAFIDSLLEKLDLEARTVHGRAEDLGHDPAFRADFDFVTARAVAALPVLAEYCVPLLKVGGAFVAPKGAISADERKAGIKACASLGAGLLSEISYRLGEYGERVLLTFEKTRNTDRKFPRPAAQIKKNPLPLN